MLKVNGYEGNYNQVLIYNDDGHILFQTERPYELQFEINTNIRNARKLMFNKHDCFEMTTRGAHQHLFRNGKDLYVHNSVIDVLEVHKKEALKHNGETNYKDVYTLKLQDGTEVKVESDYYTRTEKTDERLYREKLAEIISECLWGNHQVSHYEVAKMLEKLDITIKDINM